MSLDPPLSTASASKFASICSSILSLGSGIVGLARMHRRFFRFSVARLCRGC